MIKQVGFDYCSSNSLFTATLSWSGWDSKFGLSTKHKDTFTIECTNRSCVLCVVTIIPFVSRLLASNFTVDGNYNAQNDQWLSGTSSSVPPVIKTKNLFKVMVVGLLTSDGKLMPPYIIPPIFYAALLQRWDLPGFMCQFCPFAQILSVNVSIFTMVAISLDRYRAIMTPLRDKPTKFVAKIVIFLHMAHWCNHRITYGIISSIRKFVEEYDTRSEDYKSVDTDTNSEWKNTTHIASVVSLPPTKNLYEIYSLSLIIIQYVIPLTVISYVYIKMGIKLWMNRTPGSAQDRRDQTILQNKKRVIKMLIIVVCIFGICWLPWHLFYLCQLFAPSILKYRYINIVFFHFVIEDEAHNDGESNVMSTQTESVWGIKIIVNETSEDNFTQLSNNSISLESID
ncbi:LKR [Lepeophtheirus salmonis]|uniref:LKR n=1 Tax=Lepeophtheirus salmonis TaxID=72036 RepID=A0A7R8D1N3_LEPSM|nr:LKR [Lepeophtheirus salmonis]CAF2970224.1 LKR [Lepeophtheirus salmonis]